MLISLLISLYSNIYDIISCLSSSFFNVSTSVEYPVFVFLIIGNPNFSKSNTPICCTEFIFIYSSEYFSIFFCNSFFLSSNTCPALKSSSLSKYIP